MYPTIEDIRKIAAKGQYKRVPVCREVYADRYTPVEAMRTLRKASRHCYLLESASQTEVWGRYSFLGYEPTMEITCTDGLMKIRHTEVADKEETVKKVMHPGDTLREILREYKSPVIEEMPPFTGGLVGYFSYDYIKYSEPKLKLGEHEDPDFRDMDLMLFDQVIAFDHYRQKVLLITGVMLDDLENSYQKAEKKLAEMADVIFTATPQGFLAGLLTEEILSQVKIVDLSADYRIKDVATYEKWYGIEHKSPQFIEEAVYGLCEINRDKITEKTRLVANPGCYTTCSILTAYPMVKEGMIDVNTLIVDAKSGTSGAGRGAKVPNLFCEVNENMKAYGVASHRHTPEIEEQLGYAGNCQVTINFTPHLVPMNRGILATEYATLKRKPDGTLPTYEEVKAIYDKYYANEKFVRVLDKGSCPETKWVEGSNYVDINFVIDERTGRIIMMGALDNLVKGAAGQAVQNMNLLFGLPESEGLELVPCFP